MSAAFVLQWYCQILATPAALCAIATEWVLDVSPECVDFDTAPGAGYPTRVGLRPGLLEQVPDSEARLHRAHQRYAEHAGAFAAAYEPGVKISTRQRHGMVQDLWAIAVRQAQGSVRATDPVARLSCCFIYALPGCHECAGCPRVR